MKRVWIVILFLLLSFAASCTTYPSGGESSVDSTPEEESSVIDTFPEESSVIEESSVAEESSTPEELKEIPQSAAFSWTLEPSVEVDTVLPIRDGDTPGRFSISPSICFEKDGLLGLMNQAGTVLLPAEYTDIAHSRNLGGLIVLKSGSTSYQRLNNQYEPTFDVEFASRQLLPTTEYRWVDGTVVDGRQEPYEGTDFVVVKDGEYYALGNANGLSTDFAYTNWGPTGLTNQFFMKDEIGWHLVSPSGDDLLKGAILEPRALSNGEAAPPYPCSEGVYALQDAESGLWGFYDAAGNPLTEFVFESACPVSLGRAWVQFNGLWGLIEIHLGRAVG
ncbi:MAG: WG repeat-containing protein [Firmicutes bacterium]|nr:WG repeat-containing protein [Bacillota bacterium]